MIWRPINQSIEDIMNLMAGSSERSPYSLRNDHSGREEEKMTTTSPSTIASSSAHDDQRSPATPHESASVCFWSVRPGNGSGDGSGEGDEVVFLLGRDRYGEGDFGGKMESGESVQTTAAREAIEETLGCVCDYESLLRDLRRGQYSLALDFKVGYDSRNSRMHRSYVKRVPWDEQVVRKFEERRMRLTDEGLSPEEKQRSLNDWQVGPHLSALECALEKSYLAWRPLAFIFECLRQGGGQLRPCAVPLLSVVIHQFIQCGLRMPTAGPPQRPSSLPFVSRKRDIRWLRDWEKFMRLEDFLPSRPTLYTLRFDNEPYLKERNQDNSSPLVMSSSPPQTFFGVPDEFCRTSENDEAVDEYDVEPLLAESQM